jgi:hypothetical protein
MFEVGSGEETVWKTRGCQLFCEFKRCITSVEGTNAQNIHWQAAQMKLWIGLKEPIIEVANMLGIVIGSLQNNLIVLQIVAKFVSYM